MTEMSEQRQDICRAVTFYNDYIPASGEGSRVEFCAFGNVDGIEVGEAMTCDGKSQSMTELIWEAQKKFYRELEGNSSVQRIYIVRCEEKEKEQEFWEEDTLPFFFFCRIQCSGEKTLLMQDRSKLEKKDAFGDDSEIKVKTYLTYDNTDLFIVIRASEYAKGAEAINALHQNKNFASQGDSACILKNSFTVMAVRNQWISQLDDVQRKEWNRDKIDRVYIRLIEREGGDIGLIEENINIENRIRRAVMGTDDHVIVLSDVGWGDFLTLYEENNGIFGNRSKGSIYNVNAAGVTSQICVKLNDQDVTENGEKSSSMSLPREKEERDTELFKKQTKTLKLKLEEAEGNRSDYVNELNIILNVLPKYSGEMFNDYVFFPLLKILDTLIELMFTQKRLIHVIDKEPFYDFLAGFCFYTQNTMLTDRHTAQMLGFNVKIYDIPVKLNAFYNAYMYKITSVLNVPEINEEQKTEPVDYDFIALPGMADLVKVKELYKGVSDNQRLIKVEIPEYSFYNVRSMMIILAHETAHYVGRGLRNRDHRTEAVISSYAHVFVKYIEMRGDLKGFKTEEWLECEKRLINLLYRCLRQEIDGDFLRERRYNKQQHAEYWKYCANDSDDMKSELTQRLHEKRSANIDYFSELIPDAHTVMRDIIERYLIVVFTPILLGNDHSSTVFRTIQQAAARFITASGTKYTGVASETVLNELMALYEESFADLMSILILNVGVEEYITGIIDCAESQNMDFKLLINSEAVLRIAAVLVCILESETVEKKDVNVHDEWYRRLAECDEKETWAKVAQAAMYLWHRDPSPEDIYKDNVYCALIYDEVVLTYAVKYLLTCMEQFEEHYTGDFEGEIKNIRELFQKFSTNETNSGEEQIVEMVNFIDAYKDDMRKIMSAERNGDGNSE